MIQESGNLWGSGPGKNAIARIVQRGNLYWATNVYKYYNRHTGQLGGSSYVQFMNGKFVVGMKPLIDLETGTSYGKAIRQGISPGVGRYDPVISKRRHTGYYPGVSQNAHWNPWMREFRMAFKQIVREEVLLATRTHLKQMLRRV
jgi:hypothetical protein